MTDSITGIAKRIAEAADAIAGGDYEKALAPTCIAVGATAGKEYPTEKDGPAYTKFIDANMDVICRLGPVTILNLRVELRQPLRRRDGTTIKPVVEPSTYTLSQAIYHLVRCHVLHEAEMSPKVRIVTDGVLSFDGETFPIASGFICGLLAAAVISPVNEGLWLPTKYGMVVLGENLPLNEFWGQKRKFLDRINAVFETRNEVRNTGCH